MELPFLPLNILILGDGAVGKTSFCNAYTGSKVSEQYTPTTGLDTIHKDHLLPGTGGQRYPIIFWDFGGDVIENRFLINAAIEADAILLMYDITHIGSFEKVKLYLKKLLSFFGAKNESRDIRMPYIALIGNKSNFLFIQLIKINIELFLKKRIMNFLPKEGFNLKF
jgi:GTPase SAR1 family protein